MGCGAWVGWWRGFNAGYTTPDWRCAWRGDSAWRGAGAWVTWRDVVGWFKVTVGGSGYAKFSHSTSPTPKKKKKKKTNMVTSIVEAQRTLQRGQTAYWGRVKKKKRKHMAPQRGHAPSTPRFFGCGLVKPTSATCRAIPPTQAPPHPILLSFIQMITFIA
ncbi:hypothetical protein HanXRQr2_Chr02g0058011 [Helianthus annuus]|uniref:Uncharacterized protein n=1 Tax=Helianthus annuus TaxID=4232 RepID=A0A9K3NZ23_HELAN|nr:hypothetical protein HanXRQr2_Chr02g0058011 [Helianthus annuus]